MLRWDAGIPFTSALPLDTDSNQTRTASWRADVWAEATFKPQDAEWGLMAGENNNKLNETHGKGHEKGDKSWTKSKRSNEGVTWCRTINAIGNDGTQNWNGNEERRGRESVQNIKDEDKMILVGGGGSYPITHTEQISSPPQQGNDRHPDPLSWSACPGVHTLMGGLPVEEGSVSSEGWESWEAEAARPPSESRCVLATTGSARGSKGCNSCWTRRFLAKWWL